MREVQWSFASAASALLVSACSTPPVESAPPGSLCSISNPVESEEIYRLRVIYSTDNFEYTSIRDPACGVVFYPIAPKVWTAGYREFRSRLHDLSDVPVGQEFELEVVGRFGRTASGRNIGFIIDDVLSIRELK